MASMEIIDSATGQLRTATTEDFGGGGSGTTTDKELVVSTYRCKTAFTGASVGDTITATQIIDLSGSTPTTLSTVWRNQTTAADLASAPSAANLELTGSTALTNAQLRESSLDVITPLPTAPITGQGKIATTGVAVQLASNVLKNGVIVKANSNNAQPLFVGPAGVTNTNDGTGNGYRLDPGEAISFAVPNANSVYVNGTVGDIFYIAGN